MPLMCVMCVAYEENGSVLLLYAPSVVITCSFGWRLNSFEAHQSRSSHKTHKTHHNAGVELS